MVRKRHPVQASMRDTHHMTPVDFAQASDSYYGNQIDLEPITGVDLGAGSVNDGNIVEGGLDGSISIKPGTLPGTALDPEPPPPPVLLPLVAGLVQQEDGAIVIQIGGRVGYYVEPVADPPVVAAPVGLSDLAAYVVQSTHYEIEGVIPAQPDWTRAQEWSVQSDDLTGEAPAIVIQPGALGMSTYWWRAYAVDTVNNRSTSSNVVSIETVGDVTPPPQPQGVVVVSSMGSFAVRWEMISARDFDHSELEYREAYRAAQTTEPAYAERPAGPWLRISTGGTMVVVTGLVNSKPEDPMAYDVRVRSVDTSGNTAEPSATEPFWVNHKAADEPEMGWVDADDNGVPLVAVPSAIPGNALIWDEAFIEEIFAGMISADWIETGTLRVGNVPADHADTADDPVQIEVYDIDQHKVGTWGADGITLTDSANSKYKMVIDEHGLVIWAEVGTPAAYKVVTIGPLGIDASSITFGAARGGHNSVPNSSFEMGPFIAAAVRTNTQWGVAADWNTTRQGTDTNVTTNAGSLSMTAV